MFTVKRLSLLSLLILLNWIPLLGQIGNDTIQCYNQEELRKIASALITGNECRELLPICEKQIITLEEIVFDQEFIIKNKQETIDSQQLVIETKKAKITALEEQFSTEKRKHLWTKIKYGFTSVILGAGVVYFIIH